MVRHHQSYISAGRYAGTLWQPISAAFNTCTTLLNNTNKTRKICQPSANILCGHPTWPDLSAKNWCTGT